MRKLVVLLPVAAVVALLWMVKPDSSGEDRVVIGVSLLNLSNEFIVDIKEAMEAKAAELGVRLIVNDAERSAEQQIQHVESFLARRVDAIILNPCEVEASSPAVDKAIQAGIPIVNVNSETRSEPTAFVGSRDEESAEIAISYIARRLDGKGRLVMISGYPGQAAEIKRTEGARSALSQYPDLELIAEQTANWSREEGMALMENWLQAYRDRIDAVFAQNDEMGLGALNALQSAGVKDKVVLVSVDAIADALKAVKQGHLDGTVFQNARVQAETAVETAVRIVNGQPYEKRVLIPFELVTGENVDRYMTPR
ncbi:MAG: sugar ABC transporter substrate-binding protein [Sedimentisphaerales bacterium]|nr:sugar ABC transporter substrate-binding protein [Sedimentisphaerales bacterium]